MPKGYIIGHITVHDPEAYKTYVARDTPILLGLGGRFLVRGGQAEVVEGAAEDRHVVFEFDSYDRARAAYHDPAYQEVAQIRRASATSTIMVAEGNDEALPDPAGAAPLGYLIAHVTVHDPDSYAPYVTGNTPIMRGHGARYIVRGGRSEVLEGTLGARHVVIAYPGYAAAKAAYHDPAYQEVAQIRRDHSDGTIILVEGAA
ncbi:hypothetical protein MAA8898_01588 [Maliponia aquimaris]|uniref:DUF1330 domain-containing protein n=2 Tax=Maliponia aquimaris TaxID=1673631 RepID=A0A238K670_9RHOB|nr:hypothetical protein MAA8898_01588 [Maliponia aquimaris]